MLCRDELPMVYLGLLLLLSLQARIGWVETYSVSIHKVMNAGTGISKQATRVTLRGQQTGGVYWKRYEVIKRKYREHQINCLAAATGGGSL